MQIIENIIAAMLKEIEKHSLDLLTHYPNDLLVHDRATLELNAHRGAEIAWMVGHTHTHVSLLGMHPKENESVTYYTNLSAEDRFYLLRVGSGEQGFSLVELSRDQFTALQHTHIPYTRVGVSRNFWLMRGKEKIGHCQIDNAGTFQSPLYKAAMTPAGGISALDRAALRTWASHAVTEAAGSLFARAEFNWLDPMPLAA